MKTNFGITHSCLTAVCVLLGVLAGCQSDASRPAPATAGGSAVTGPDYLLGTVGSLVQLRGYRPQKVSGFGIIVGLDGTGSREVPAFLRQNLLNEMRKRKVGSASLGWESWTPERMLADLRTAVVAVEGFVPAGAVKGTRFDLLVSAHPLTQTSSLAGGKLWTVDLRELGTDPRQPWTKRWAEARGPIYLNPLAGDTDEQARFKHVRQAVVIAGGEVVRPRLIELVLNQPGFLRCRVIADRINERFSLTTDRVLIAEAKTESLIKIHIPSRYADHPETLLQLISCLYVVRDGAGFELRKAEKLLAVLEQHLAQQPTSNIRKVAFNVVNVLESLGRTTIPALRKYYDHSSIPVRLAVLEAGARLKDERAASHLLQLTDHADADVRVAVAQSLVFLPRSLKGSKALSRLLDDAEQGVRVASYESLAAINDPLIERVALTDSQDRIKFIIDRVPVKKPLIYITQRGLPRIAIFNGQLGFTSPMLAQIWDRHLMLRAEGDGVLEMFYQAPGQSKGKTYKLAPTVATLSYMLGHHPSLDEPQEGLDLSYSQVVDALYHLSAQGHVDAPVQLEINPLAELIGAYQQTPAVREDRPEFGADIPIATPTGGEDG
jgi:hypothetical protein